MTETKELLKKPLQKTCCKVQNLEEVKSRPVLEREEKTTEKTKRQCRKYLLVYVDGCKKPVT